MARVLGPAATSLLMSGECEFTARRGLQQADSDLDSPLRRAADHLCSPTGERGGFQRDWAQAGASQVRTSPEKTLVTTVGEILCFAGDRLPRAPSVGVSRPPMQGSGHEAARWR